MVKLVEFSRCTQFAMMQIWFCVAEDVSRVRHLCTSLCLDVRRERNENSGRFSNVYFNYFLSLCTEERCYNSSQSSKINIVQLILIECNNKGRFTLF